MKPSQDGEKQRYGSSVPPHMRQGHQRTRIDQHGQVVIEPEENLSDKEIYPHMKIPAIGMVPVILASKIQFH